MLRSVYRYLFLLSLSLPSIVQGQNQSMSGFDTLSLQDLMNIKITVASIKELTPRQSPGIVTYISADEIKNSGARDLMDVLEHVPGFQFGSDVEGVIGLGVRGNWAHEGKVVLFIDGQEMNESLYSTLQFGNHYPTENIDHIEIIRGPGSAMYGGYAAYAVINVITRQVNNEKEIQASTFYGATSKDFSRRGMNLFLGTKQNNNSISLQAYAAQAQRSHDDYNDVYGSRYSMINNSGLNNLFLDLKANTGRLSFKALADIYHTYSRDEYQHALPEKYPITFDSYFLESAYEIPVSDNWKIQTKINYKNQVPWAVANSPVAESFHIISERLTGSVNSSADVNDKLNIAAGLSYFIDKSKQSADQVFQTNNKNTFFYNNFSFFTQGLIRYKYFNLIAGVRYNDNSRYTSSLVPRIGITHEFDKLHVKLLYSKSFRSPSTQNIDLGKNIKPERTDVLELETGYSITDDAYISINAYNIVTKDPIIYYYDTITNFDAYTNLSKTGTHGLELSFRYKRNWGGIDIGASYYQSADGKDLLAYAVPGDDDEHLGMSPFKSDIALRYSKIKNFSFYLSLTTSSERYAIVAVDSTNDKQTYATIPMFNQLNFNSVYHFPRLKGLELSFGIYNLLNEKQLFVQPYNSEHGAIPGMRREFQLKIVYQNF